jgi:hypothetical protein
MQGVLKLMPKGSDIWSAQNFNLHELILSIAEQQGTITTDDLLHVDHTGRPRCRKREELSNKPNQCRM